MHKNLNARTSKWFWAVLPGQKQICLCIFQEQIWLPNWTCYRKNKLLFWPGQNALNGLIPYAYWFLDMLISTTQVLRLYIQMFPSYGLYVCIILETTHHRTTSRIFCNITQKTTTEENSHKMIHISSLIVPFLIGGLRIIFDMDQVSSREGKRKE